MSDNVTIITNNHRREVIDAWQLTPKERAEFDYLDWEKIEAGSESASFFRYHGQLYDLDEFSAFWGLHRDGGLPDWAAGWEGYISDSFFSGMLVKYVDENEWVVVARFYS